VTISIEFEAPLPNALSALDRLNAFLSEIRGWGLAVDTQVVVTPIGMLTPEIAAAVAEAEGSDA